MGTEATEVVVWLEKPVCIMSDRELGILQSVEDIFPGVRHLLCQVHVDHNVKAYATTMGIDPKNSLVVFVA